MVQGVPYAPGAAARRDPARTFTNSLR
jgi:hypothetical protein